MSRRRLMVTGPVAFLIVAGLVGAACSGSHTTTAPSHAVGKAGFDAVAGGDAGVSIGAAAPEPAVGVPADATGGAGLNAGLPAIGPKIIKTGNLSLEVKMGSFDDRFQQATLIAGRHGGFVASSQTSQDRRRSGTLVIRVPADQFEAALGEIRGLGKVTTQAVYGSDVTPQFVDLQARLRNWETQESVLLKLLAKSKTIDESIKVQRALQDVQLAIEEIRGQLRVLADQTDFSTISVSMIEAGPGAVSPKKQSSLARAWHQAIHGFVAVIAAVVVGIGYLLPFVLMAGVLVLVWWGLRRYRRVREARVAPAA
jgi:hypothetical protein